MNFYQGVLNMKHAMLAACLTATSLTASAVQAQIFHSDSGAIQGSLCVGFDCENSETYGYDTVRLKESNVVLHFEDTSSASGGFPHNDWRLVANDTNPGGRNYFAIRDGETNRTNFLIEAGSRTNAIYVDANGEVGFGTSSPAVELHTVKGDSPTLRLDQDGSSGFAPQTWDLVGNENNFFIRDVTHGSKLPFKIKPGAPNDAIFVKADGDIGMNTDSPSSALHIRRTGNVSTGLRLEQNGTVAANWEILNNEATGRLTFSAGATVPFKFAPTAVENLLRVGIDANDIVDINGALDVSGAITSASITTSGSCSVGCDAVFEADYDLPSIAEHTQAMWELGYLPNVGPTFDGQQIDVADKLGRVLNELEHAHIYIAQQNDQITGLNTHVEMLTMRLTTLERQLQD